MLHGRGGGGGGAEHELAIGLHGRGGGAEHKLAVGLHGRGWGWGRARISRWPWPILEHFFKMTDQFCQLDIQ